MSITKDQIKDRMREINGLICEARGKMEELYGDLCVQAANEFRVSMEEDNLADWVTTIEIVEGEIDDFYKFNDEKAVVDWRDGIAKGGQS